MTKSGTKTHGLDRFFSSIVGKPVLGIAVFTLSLISVTQRKSFPLLTHQVVKEASDDEQEAQSGATTPGQRQKSKSTSKSKSTRTRTRKSKGQNKSQSKKKRGRPKGSKNINREDVELSPYLQKIQSQLLALKQIIGGRLTLVYVVLDGAFGHNYALQMVRRCGMQLISKLQYNAALYFPYTGPYRGRGPRKKYGNKLNAAQLPQEYLKKSSREDSIQTDIYQMPLLHKRFPQLLNVVIIVKTNLDTQKHAHAILFSSDMTLSSEQIIHYYQLRFQIEFNFRDATQYWGLEDCMNINEQQVTNAINLSFFMVNVSQILLYTFRRVSAASFSVNDLKAHFLGLKYVEETLKFLPKKPDPIVMQHISEEIAKLGSINVA